MQFLYSVVSFVVLWRSNNNTYQFFIFVFNFQSRCDAISSLNEGLSLGSLCDIMDEDTSDINTEIEDTIADQLKIDKKNNDILTLVMPNQGLFLCSQEWILCDFLLILKKKISQSQKKNFFFEDWDFSCQHTKAT